MNAAAHPPLAGQWGVVAALGSTQTLGWASSYYLPAFLAAPLAAELGLPVTRVFAAFTLALLVSALIGPAAGRAIDRHGGRAVLRVTNRSSRAAWKKASAPSAITATISNVETRAKLRSPCDFVTAPRARGKSAQTW